MVIHQTLQKSLKETPGQFWVRIKSGGARKPLRTIAELAEELGVPVRTLTSTFAQNDGPKPKYRTGGGTTVKNTWYDPDEVRTWWKNHRKETP